MRVARLLIVVGMSTCALTAAQAQEEQPSSPSAGPPGAAPVEPPPPGEAVGPSEHPSREPAPPPEDAEPPGVAAAPEPRVRRSTDRPPEQAPVVAEDAEAQAQERRSLTSFGAKAIPLGRSTIAIGMGYPYLVDTRIMVGALPEGSPLPFDAGVLFRTYGQRWELGVIGRVTLFGQEPFAFGAFVDAGGGSTYFDDSKRNYFFADGGVAASLTGLGAVTVTGRAYLNAWSDRHCPGKADEGDPTELCADYRSGDIRMVDKQRVDDLVGVGNIFKRDSGVRGVLSLVVELALQEHWNLWIQVEGLPRQDERAAFTDLFHSSMFDTDARSYARIGLTYKF